MPEYTVEWQLPDVDADTPRAAVLEAYASMQKYGCLTFSVIDEHGNVTLIDLNEEDEEVADGES